MFIFKRFFLVAVLLTSAGCMSSDYDADKLFSDDFSLEVLEFDFQETTPSKEVSQTTSPAYQTAPMDSSVGLEDFFMDFPEGFSDPQPEVSVARTSNSESIPDITKKVAGFENQFKQIQDNISKNNTAFLELKKKSADEVRQYYNYNAEIRTRLQNGTTQANPELIKLWQKASNVLNSIDKNSDEATKLSNTFTRIKSELDSLLETIEATLLIPGATESDHEKLKGLEDKANQIVVSLNRLNSDISAWIFRQQQFFNMESKNAPILKKGIQNGSLFSQASVTNTAFPMAMTAADMPEASLSGRRPLMIIRFNKKNVAYKQPLYQTIKATLKKQPDAKFEIVSVTPENSEKDEQEAAKNAKIIRETMMMTGISEDRIFLTKTKNPTVKTPEVRLYLK